MDRKDFLKWIGVGGGALVMPSVLTSCMGRTQEGGSPAEVMIPASFSNVLQLPGKIKTTDFELATNPGSVSLQKGIKTNVYTTNGLFPGPTIRARRGDRLSISFSNGMDQESILHWHGMIVPPAMDGHPRDAVESGQQYNYNFTINQRAGTYWYHPHPDGYTGPQVYKGMAGFFIVEDEEEAALHLPSGDYEIPLLIQDKKISSDGELLYDTGGMMQSMMGFFGDQILMNGTPAPYREVEARWYRMRVLNGSNARIYTLAFSDDVPFQIIGSDGGLLPKPIEANELMLAPGERADILVDFSGFPEGEALRLRSKGVDAGRSGSMMNRDGGGMMGGGGMMNDRGGMQGMMGSINNSLGQSFDIMEFRIVPGSGDSFSVDNQLSTLDFPTAEEVANRRTINLTMEMMQGMALDGRFFDMNRIDQQVQQGAVEEWTFVNQTPMPHPMHIHAVQFKVIERTGGRGLLPTETGWKDTVLVMPEESVTVRMRFDADPGVYVYHCHNLEHEDNGMMANLKIV